MYWQIDIPEAAPDSARASVRVLNDRIKTLADLWGEPPSTWHGSKGGETVQAWLEQVEVAAEALSETAAYISGSGTPEPEAWLPEDTCSPLREDWYWQERT